MSGQAQPPDQPPQAGGAPPPEPTRVAQRPNLGPGQQGGGAQPQPGGPGGPAGPGGHGGHGGHGGGPGGSGPHGGSGGSGGGARIAIIAGVSVAVLVVLSLVAFAAVKLLGGGGAQPADVLPARTLGLVSVDLDPGASQKVDAIRTLRKFPMFREKSGVQEQTDLRQKFFEEAVKGSACAGKVDYDQDIKPWIGQRAAVGAVRMTEKNPVAPVVAIEVSDEGKAQDAMKKLVDCGSPGNDSGYAVSNGYLVVSDSNADAKRILDDGKNDPLADDSDYQRWTGELGDAGIVNGYVSPDAARYVVDHPEALSQLGSSGYDSYSSATPKISPELRKRILQFKGAAGTLRFADGEFEVEAVGGGKALTSGSTAVGEKVVGLPSDTAMALGFSVPDGFVKQFMDGFAARMGTTPDQLAMQAQSQTGLQLPQDLQTLLGDSLVLSLGGQAPADLSAISGPQEIPFAISIQGNAGSIEGVINKLVARTGATLSQIGITERKTGDGVTLATQSSYADKVTKGGGGLGDSEQFTSVIPNGSKATSVFYLDFNSKWVSSISKSAGTPPEVAQYLRPLKALGVSSWVDGDVTHVDYKLTTD